MLKLRNVLLDNGEALYAETLCVLAALELMGSTQPQPVRNVSDGQLGRAIDYIGDKLSEDIGLTELAEVAGLSRYHFVRVFKKAWLGLSPYQYLLSERVARAKRLLAYTGLPLSEVASQCGFRSTAHFRQAFTRAVGKAPNDFRKST